MDVRIQSLKFDADKRLVAFIEEKVSKLSKFSDEILFADVTLKLENDTEHANKVAVLKLGVKGEDLVSEHKCKTFEESVDLSVEAMKKQLSKHKNRFAK